MDTRYNLQGIKIALVFPPYQDSEDEIFLKTAKRDLGKIPPLALCAVAAFLEQYGAQVKIIDANAQNLSLSAVCAELALFAPDCIGYTLSTYQFDFTLQWIKDIRVVFNVPVIVGGPHARLYAREILTHACIDYCVLGDAEECLHKLLHGVFEGNDLSSIGGISYRDQAGCVQINDFSLYLSDLDTVPYPSRHLLDNMSYYSLISRYKNFTAMSTTRGCVFQCTFCDNHYIPYRMMSPKRVVDEIEYCYNTFGIREIDMFDGLFSVDKKRLQMISHEIIQRRLKIFWSFRTRADLIDEATLSMLKQAGCIRIYYGIESGSPVILRQVKKCVELDKIRYAIQLTKKIGIDTFGFFMIGNEGETYETIDETARFIHMLPLDYIQIAPIFYPPNTEVYEHMVQHTGKDYWKEYTLDPTQKVSFPVLGTGFTRLELYAIIRKMYLRFYLNPRNVVRLLFRVRSFAELKRCFEALMHMVIEVVLSVRGGVDE